MLSCMSRDARQQAHRYYTLQGRDLMTDLTALGENARGIIAWTPQLVALMKPVCCHHAQDWLRLESSPAHANAWYVHLLIGSLDFACQLGARLESYDYICFQRGLRSTRVHVSSWERLIARGSTRLTTPHPPQYT